jgi:hypothetical protein
LSIYDSGVFYVQNFRVGFFHVRIYPVTVELIAGNTERCALFITACSQLT